MLQWLRFRTQKSVRPLHFVLDVAIPNCYRLRVNRIRNRKRIYPDLKTWRLEMGLSQREAARQLGISQPAYNRIENQTRAPKPRPAQAISRETGVPLESILGLS